MDLTQFSKDMYSGNVAPYQSVASINKYGGSGNGTYGPAMPAVAGAQTQKYTQNTVPSNNNAVPQDNNQNNNNQNNNQNKGQSNNNAAMDAINEAFGNYMQRADEARSGVRQGYETDVNNLNKRVGAAAEDIATEGEGLNTGVEKEQKTFNDVLKSAFSEAIKSYNALDQQRKAGYGGGSSAGQAIGELAKQEFFRQQGQVEQKGVEGTAQFAEEKAKIATFVATKKRDLDLFKEEEFGKLQSNLRDRLQLIDSNQDQTTMAKGQAKLQIVQQAQSQAEAIAQADKEFRTNLGLAAVNQMQAVTGRTFTPAEIKATIAEFMTDLPSSVGVPQTGTTIAPGRNSISTNTEDKFADLSIPNISNQTAQPAQPTQQPSYSNNLTPALSAFSQYR